MTSLDAREDGRGRNRGVRLLGVVVANGFSSESRVFANLLAHRADGYDALVFHHTSESPHPKDEGALGAFRDAAGVPVVGFDAGWRRNDDDTRSLPDKLASWARLHGSIGTLLQTAWRYRPTLVYSSQQRWDSHLATILAAALRVPQVMHLHYRIGPFLGRGVLRRLRKVDGVACVSDFILRQALEHGVPPGRARTVHNSLALDAVSPVDRREARRTFGLDSDAPVFVIAARLEREKGQLDTVRAFARVVRELPKARLLMAGDGRLRGELEDLIRSSLLSGSVELLGHRRDVPLLLKAADVFVHPSLAEPFGLSILEASAASLPTIAYREGGPVEIIRHQEGGVLVEPGDVDALAGAMLALARDRELAVRMGENARKDLGRFSPSEMGKRFSRFLGDVARRS